MDAYRVFIRPLEFSELCFRSDTNILFELEQKISINPIAYYIDERSLFHRSVRNSPTEATRMRLTTCADFKYHSLPLTRQRPNTEVEFPIWEAPLQVVPLYGEWPLRSSNEKEVEFGHSDGYLMVKIFVLILLLLLTCLLTILCGVLCRCCFISCRQEKYYTHEQEAHGPRPIPIYTTPYQPKDEKSLKLVDGSDGSSSDGD